MFKKSLKQPIVWALILIMLLVTGCGAAKKEQLMNASADTSKKKNELILAIGYEPEEGLDPTTGWGRYGSPLFQSTILKRDKELKIVNDLATGYEVSQDGLTWTVHLRDDVKFSDGHPLTAEDVVYTYETAAKSGSVLDVTVMKSVEALDDYTVKFTLNHPQSTFVSILVSTGIVPKHAHGADYSKNPIGSGPFKLVQWDVGQQMIVEANSEYYGPKSAFKKLTFLFLQEDAAYAAAKAGEVDMAFVLPNVAKQQIPGMHLVIANSVDNRGILFPFVKAGEKTKDGIPIGNDVTADIAIRKAINIAIDRKKLVDGIFEGFGTPAYSVADGMPWYNPETVVQDGDLKQAKQILSDAGWEDVNGDGIREKGSLKAQFTLIYQADDASRQSLAIAVSDMIRPLGIHVKVEGKSWDDIAKMMHSNAVLFGWGSYDPLEMYNLYSSKTAGLGWYNTSFYSNPVVDEYMEKALQATSEEEALGYWKKAQWDGTTGFSAKGDAPWAWLVNRQHLYLVRDGLEIGQPKIQPHGHGWPITDNIVEWHWKN
ncbi:ABC transporter substrate-binding protein [Brevibacillus reuszeri]|uniref:ABC transporter substrate-binding protein n=1 Tax=Brevibacillus reuszeri TaxID=54915 RepID=A0A0K9YMK8_9BACL|nr:ABC transporter substrate-binding protein [Brevibacillus reuszeri]KNB69988.1 nickel ABC transporter substrate-binding protein [Brevibacillus reuszeri]MED1858355.1 ABC transporter substrate-binding protein [Brevibacillus reuszeri]GED68645.1 ABC transporter substrate-binding protein [Brevibacillus reuszeri]